MKGNKNNSSSAYRPDCAISKQNDGRLTTMKWHKEVKSSTKWRKKLSYVALKGLSLTKGELQ